ncbi:MAG: energy transducer TonB [Bacteroidales bacterium]|jgi:protein TonB|nr:energy transducer TonB [Bacteroidales bacterium]
MKRLLISLLLLFGLTAGGFAQSFTLTRLSEMPSFEGGGVAAFTLRVQEAITYPSGNIGGTEGDVTVGFFISKDGKLLMSKVLKGLGDDFDAEALRAVRETAGTWAPARDDAGNPLDWYVTIRVAFKAPDNQSNV